MPTETESKDRSVLSVKKRVTHGLYYNLPFLDVCHQRRVFNGLVNALKTPLRHAINGCRMSDSGMLELKALLKESQEFIEQIEEPPKAKTRTRKKTLPPVRKEEYELPG